ncbi:ABC transporter permease [Variovorax sp. WS11]|uniref:ABC transporter substrate-binding protein n=1 Tax=Variovorax sp. WS11 TaxID=1105204 RepID=UPI000D0DD99C|nr:ABC transporter substrate-binding protein [Variovorax sp. WS11]NDZ17765.1 ABC transporter substrate-binding protein [Variovorax sp. WS11]PSL80193.1 ABC transporter permease [Variovorax sp. WS11]
MSNALTCAAFAVAALISSSAPAQDAASEPVRIGVLTDLSGGYSDLTGAGSVKAVQMAVADFGGKVLSRPIEVLSADHQNKVDVAATKVRQWFDVEKVNMVNDLMNSAVAIAVTKVAAEKNRIAIVNGAGTDALTNEECTPVTIHYAWDTFAMASGTAYAVASQGGKSWYFVTADYAFGKALEANASKVVADNGGKSLGSARHPLAASDFSSFMLQAQSSGAQVVALANGGQDVQNSLRSASEFGLTKSGKQRLVALAVFNTDISAVGLRATQGILATEAFYWDLNDETRAWSQRFFKETGKMPTAMQAGDYSSTAHYLKAVAAAGTTETSAVLKKMRELPVNDFFAKNGRIRDDGRFVHDVYLVQVKRPEESKSKWDIYKVMQTIPGDAAFQPISRSRCPAMKGRT